MYSSIKLYFLKRNQWMFSLKINETRIFFNDLCFLYCQHKFNDSISTYKQVYSRRYYLSHELKSWLDHILAEHLVKREIFKRNLDTHITFYISMSFVIIEIRNSILILCFCKPLNLPKTIFSFTLFLSLYIYLDARNQMNFHNPTLPIKTKSLISPIYL